MYLMYLCSPPNPMKGLGPGWDKGKAPPYLSVLDHCSAARRLRRGGAEDAGGCCGGMLSQCRLCWYRAGEDEGSIKCHVCSPASQ